MLHIKRIISIMLSAATVAVLAACGSAPENAPKGAAEVPTVTGEFKTTVLKCGKADAIVLETENHTVLIDTGESSDGDKVLGYLAENGIDYVDYLFITHFDQDHVGGAPEVMSGVEIGEIITPDYEGNNSEYEDYIAALGENGITPTLLTDNMTFTLDDALFEVYPPQKSVYAEEDNDYSLVISVTHGESSFLYAGDAETERLAELYGQLGDMEHTFLKVPHHGVYTKGMDEFIESAAPDYAVITCGKSDPPDDEVLQLLEAVGSEVYLTTDGTVTAVSDGTKITITQ